MARIKDYQNESGEPIFFAACGAGSHKIASYLLTSGFTKSNDINFEPTYPGETAMFRALYGNHIGVVQVLLPYRPELLRATPEGQSCLSILHLRGSAAMFATLRKHQYWSRARVLLYAQRKLSPNTTPIARLPKPILLTVLRHLRVACGTEIRDFTPPL